MINNIFKIETKEFFNIFNNPKYETDNKDIKNLIDFFNDTIFTHSENNINIDYKDILTLYENTTEIYIAFIESDNLVTGLKYIADKIILKNTNMKKIDKSILIHIKTHYDYSLINIGNNMKVIHEVSDDNSSSIFGLSVDYKFKKHDTKIFVMVSY